MEKLLSPDFGLLFWTIVNFILLVAVLGKFAWKPLTAMTDAIDKKIADDQKNAQEARLEAQKLRDDLDVKIKNISREAEDALKKSAAMAAAEREALLGEAKKSAENMIKTAKEEISAQKTRALEEVKKEIVEISLLAASQVVALNNDKDKNAAAVKNTLKEMDKGHS